MYVDVGVTTLSITMVFTHGTATFAEIIILHVSGPSKENPATGLVALKGTFRSVNSQ